MTVLVDVVRYTLRIAVDAAEIEAAQRLRYRVFAGELGAHMPSAVAGVDVDEFDEVCDHLVVREEQTGDIVGTYRMLPPGRYPRRYADSEFARPGFAALDDQLVETGRSCVDSAHRDGAVINLMWAGIARYMHLTGFRWLAGCASIGLTDGGVQAAGVWDLVRRKHLAPPLYRVTPRNPWPVPDVPAGRVAVPPLLRGYLRLGAWVCGPAAYDPDFDCADLYVLLGLDRMDPRYLKHFLGG